MPPNTDDRVPSHTSGQVNGRIQREAEERVRHCATNPADIDSAIARLDREWDIERTLETNASVLAFLGVAFGVFVSGYFLLLPALVTVFLFQHAVQGWCPPLPILRRLGFRTSREIHDERHALKALRGDYQAVNGTHNRIAAAQAAFAAARA